MDYYYHLQKGGRLLSVFGRFILYHGRKLISPSWFFLFINNISAFKNEVLGVTIHCTTETQKLAKESSAIFVVPPPEASSCLDTPRRPRPGVLAARQA